MGRHFLIICHILYLRCLITTLDSLQCHFCQPGSEAVWHGSPFDNQGKQVTMNHGPKTHSPPWSLSWWQWPSLVLITVLSESPWKIKVSGEGHHGHRTYRTGLTFVWWEQPKCLEVGTVVVFFILMLFAFWDRLSLASLGQPCSCYVAQASLPLMC